MEAAITLTLVILAVLCVAGAHIFSAIKSGCFYAVGRQALPLPPLLAKYIKNLHYAQTPFWYFIFGGFGLVLTALFSVVNPGHWWINILAAYLVSQGTSAMCSPIYQGFINVGCGRPFIDPAENKRMELANPINNKTKWIARFWHGKIRILSAAGGVLMISAGIYIVF